MTNFMHVSNIYPISIYIDIGYILLTLGGHMSVEKFLCALQAGGNKIFVIYTFVLDICCQ